MKEVNNLLQALKEAGCNENRIVLNGIIGREALKGIDRFLDKWQSLTEPQVNKVIIAIRSLLHKIGEPEIAGEIKADGIVGNKVNVGIKTIKAIYAP